MKTISLLRRMSLSLLFIVGVFFMFGCLGGSEQEPAPLPPPAPSPYSTDSDLFKIDPNAEYGNDVANSTPYMERKLTTYELLPFAKKKEYDELQKKKEKNRSLINQARVERMGADIAIIEVLKGGAAVEKGNNESYRQVHSDPEAEIKHQRWVKEKCDIEIEGLETENAKLDRDMDKILKESEKSCFPKDTLVLLKDGSTKPIQKIATGDQVMVYDIGANEISYSKVNETYVSPNNHLYMINNSISATAYERFLTQDGWKKIRDLEAGQDSIFDGNGYVQVESIQKQTQDLTVYNLNIDTAHNFFVSPQDGSKIYLIHNSSGGHGGSGGGK